MRIEAETGSDGKGEWGERKLKSATACEERAGKVEEPG